MTASGRCPCCLSERIGPWHRSGGHEIFRCAECSSGFLDPDTLPPDATPLYTERYFKGDPRRVYADYRAERHNHRKAFQAALRWLESTTPRGRLLEVGCAMGFFLEAAREAGWEVRGVEISDYAARIAREELGLDVLCADFTSPGVPLPEERMEAVVALDVLEHLLQPPLFLEKVRRVLRDGGVILISTGQVDSLSARLAGRRWRLIAPPVHVYYFSLPGLTALLRRHGFEILGMRRFWKRYSLGAVLAAVGLKLTGPVSRIPIPVQAFDVMYVLARRTG